jgi:RNA polymerase sigma-70 factor (ECF subfamily)
MEITDLLRRAHDGDSDALQAVIPLVDNELKRLASSHLRREHSSESLQTTVLVHEAFLRLAGSRLPDCENRSHFFGIAAHMMRQVLVDTARTRQAAKRGPGLEYPLDELPELRSVHHFAIPCPIDSRTKEPTKAAIASGAP